MSKKASKNKPSGSSHAYQPNELVLAKLRGFPPWPGMIIDDTDIPSHVAKERPNAKKGPGNVFCVRFFPTGDYSWSSYRELSLLKKHEIEAYIAEPHKKNGELLDGYKVALDPAEWLARKKTEAEKVSAYDPEGEVDELEDEEDADGEESEKKSKGVKRKRDSEGKSKSRKSIANDDKAKRTGKKVPKSSAAVESEDEANPPAPKKVKKETTDDPEIKKIRDWRHALQRVFLGKAKAKDEDMETHNKLFTDVEQFEGMKLFHLQETKIGKVMKHISLAEDDKIPRDAEFNFRRRAGALVEKWQKTAAVERESAEEAQAQVNGNPEPAVAVQSTDVTMAPSEPNIIVETLQATGPDAPTVDVAITDAETIPNGQVGQGDVEMAVDSTA